MAGVGDRELHDKLPGIQLAVFETVWPAFEQLSEVLVRLDDGELKVYCRFAKPPTASDKADCQRLLGEVLEAAFDAPNTSFEFGVSKPSGAYDQVMSEKLFTAIAKRVAPWRLQAGR